MERRWTGIQSRRYPNLEIFQLRHCQLPGCRKVMEVSVDRLEKHWIGLCGINEKGESIIRLPAPRIGILWAGTQINALDGLKHELKLIGGYGFVRYGAFCYTNGILDLADPSRSPMNDSAVPFPVSGITF